MDDLQFCTACGNRRHGTYRFCGQCGSPFADGAATPVASSDAEPVQHAEAQHAAAAATVTEPPTGPMPIVPPPRPSPGNGHGRPPVPGGPSGSWAAPSGGWAAPAGQWAPPGRPGGGAAARGWTVAAFTRGDWAGAAAAVAAGIGSMIVLATAALLLLGVADLPAISAGNVVSLVAMVVALSFGGSVSASASTGFSFGGSATEVSGGAGLDASPLLITMVGLVAVSVVFLRRLRSRRAGLVDVVTQAARVWALLCAALIVVGLVGRTSPDPSLTGFATSGGPRIVVSAGIAGTLLGATVWLALVLTLVVAWRLPAVLPARVRAWRDIAGGPVAGAGVAVAVGCVLLLAGTMAAALLDGGVGGAGGAAATLGNAGIGPLLAAILLFAPNLLLGAFGFASGVPLTVAADASGSASLSAGASQSLLDATALTPELWLAPLAVAVALLVGGVVTALHAPDIETARRHGWLMGVALAVGLGVIGVATSVSVNGALLGASAGGTAHLNYVLGPVAGLVWGALGGALGALIAPGLPVPIVQGIRRHVVGARQRALGVPVPAPRLAAAPGSFAPPAGNH